MLDYKPDAAAGKEDSSGDLMLLGRIGAVIGLIAFAVFCVVMLLLR